MSEEAGTTTDAASLDVATPQPRRQVRVSGSIMKSVIYSAAESPFLAMGIVQLEIRRTGKVPDCKRKFIFDYQFTIQKHEMTIA